MNPTTTALVLIEFQNDFTTEGGTLHGAVKEVQDREDVLTHAAQAADAIRKAGGSVLHCPITFAPGYGEITSHPYGILAGVVDSNSFVAGGWGAEICQEMTPVEGDIIIEGKRGLDAFGSTNLDFVLRSKGITTVVLAGYLTNCCVESTMRSAYEKGFEVVTLTDAVAATSVEEHEAAIKFDYPMFSKPMTTEEFIGALTADQELADSSRGY